MRQARSGLTLIEAVITMVITSVMFVAALRATAAVGVLRASAANRTIAQKLATGLMSDILVLPYAEPNNTPILFGPEAGESTTSKVGWDDVDDFNGWSESPPQDRLGVAMSDLTGWKRTVKVERVSAADGSTAAAAETGVKRITVTVTRRGAVLCTRIALRTAAP